jgi:HK97 family phage major capsid protein
VPIEQLPPGLGRAISGEQWESYILERLGFESVMLRSGVRRVMTTNPIVHVPRFESDSDATWVGELEEIPAAEPEGGDLVLRPRKVGNSATLSAEVVADSSPASINSIGDALLQAVALAIDGGILVGGGGKAPEGIIPKVEQIVPGAIDYDHTVDAIGLVGEHGGSPDAMFVNPSGWVELLKLKDGNDRPLIAPDVTEQAAGRFVGLRVFISPSVPTGTALVAVTQQIVCAVRSDPQITFSSDVKFLLDAVVAKVTARCDAALNDARGLALIQAESARAKKAA